jgi:hypothetical protein
VNKGTTLATFKISPQTWDDFKRWAVSQNSNGAEALRYLIGECLNGNLRVPALNSPQKLQRSDRLVQSELDQMRLADIELQLKDLWENVEALQPLTSTLQGILESLEGRSEEGTDTSQDKNNPLTGHPGRGKMVDSVLIDELRSFLENLEPMTDTVAPPL